MGESHEVYDVADWEAIVGATIVSVYKQPIVGGLIEVALADGRGLDIQTFGDRTIRVSLVDAADLTTRRVLALANLRLAAERAGYAITVTADLRRGETPDEPAVADRATRAMTLEAAR